MCDSILHQEVRRTLAKNRRYNLVLNLIKSGADASTQNQDGLTPAELALSLEPEGRLATAIVIQECNALEPVEAFKRIITRGNLFLVEALLEHLRKQLEPEVTISSLELALAELKARNVLLSTDIVNRIHYLLVEADYQRNVIDDDRTSETEQRVTHLIECIEFLEKNYRKTGEFNDMDGRFVLYLRQILQHVFFLKNEFKQLPLMQLQFCLAIFIGIIDLGPFKPIYCFMLDKEIVIDFLTTLRRVLRSDKLNEELSAEIYFTCLSGGRSTKHKLRRNIIADIRRNRSSCKKLQQISQKTFEFLSSQDIVYLNKCCQQLRGQRQQIYIRKRFQALIKAYYAAKSFYSISKMIYAIKTICNVNLDENSPNISTSIAALKRAVQIIGEMVKSTSNTPNISRKLDQRLRLLLIQPFVDLSKDLRQFFSHDYSLAKQYMEYNCPIKHFVSLRDSLIKAVDTLTYTLMLQTTSVFKRYIVRLQHLGNIDRMRSYVKFIGVDVIRFRLNEVGWLEKHLPFLDKLMADPDAQIAMPMSQTYNLFLNIMRNVMHEFFFLGMYILQYLASADRVRVIAKYILQRRILPNDFDTKSSLRNNADRVYQTYLHMEDLGVKVAFHNIWLEITNAKLKNLQFLKELSHRQEDLVLEEISNIFKQVGLVQSTNIVQKVTGRLSKMYYQNLFNLNNKYHVLSEEIKDRQSGMNVRDHQQQLKQMRAKEERHLQQKFNDIVNSMTDVVARYGDPKSVLSFELAPVDGFAIEYYLLEATEILCSLNVYQNNMHSLKNVVPVITGRNLRNYLAHDSSVYDVLTGFSTTVVSNVLFFVRHQIPLYQNKRSTVSRVNRTFTETFDDKIKWTADQIKIFNEVKVLDIPKIATGISTTNTTSLFLVPPPDFEELFACGPYKRNTLIHWAVLRGELQLVRSVLVQCRDQIDDTNFFLETALGMAVRFGYRDIVQLLVENDADVHLGTWSPISIATCLGDLEMIKLLEVRLRTSVSSKNRLIRAVQHHHFEVFVYLHQVLEYNFETDLNLLHEAIERGQMQFVQYILESPRGRQLINSDLISITPLMRAAQYGRYDVFQLLLQSGADPLKITAYNYTALHFAVCGRNRKILNILVQLRNLDINAITKDNASPLSMAIDQGDLKMVQYLLRNGAQPTVGDVNMVGFLEFFEILPDLFNHNGSLINASHDLHGKTILMYAVSSGKVQVVRDLIARGVDVNAQAPGGSTALHIAAGNNSHEICELLIQAGCSLSAVNGDGKTALVLAVEGRYISLARFLLGQGADSESVRNFRYSSDLNASLLHKFAQENLGYSVRFLLEEFDFDPDVTDDEGKTALDYAENKGHQKIVKILAP